MSKPVALPILLCCSVLFLTACLQKQTKIIGAETQPTVPITTDTPNEPERQQQDTSQTDASTTGPGPEKPNAEAVRGDAIESSPEPNTFNEEVTDAMNVVVDQVDSAKKMDEQVVAEQTESSIARTINSVPDSAKNEQAKPMSPKSFNLAGQIVLDQSQIKEKTALLQHTFIYFELKNKSSEPLPIMREVISTHNKQFTPEVLAITKGSQVSFPNMDRILHNVFSVSPNSEFDLGLYSAGTTKEVAFDDPGVIYVHCNIHHSMQADILVLDTPYFVQADSQGNFELADIPDAAGTLKIWHPRANIQSLEMNANNINKPIKQSVLITRPEVPKHRNKFGHSYRRKRY